MKVYNTVIIGAGNIGALYDTPSSKEVLTHAHAFKKNKGFNLLGFYDINIEKAKKAASIWNTAYYHSFEETFKNKVDVVSICVPDEYHYDYLINISNYDVKAIFLEKPIVKNIKEAKDIVNKLNEKNINCLVNYTRRFVTEMSCIRSLIRKNIFGNFICGSGYYGKGIVHNGSHMIDLIRYLLDEIIDVKVNTYKHDYYNDDPSVSGMLNLKNGGTFSLNFIPCELYTVFEMDILFEKKRIRIIDSGFQIEEYDIKDNEIFNGYKNLIKVKEYHTQLDMAMSSAVSNLFGYLHEGEELKCTLDDGFKVLKICELLKKGI